MRCASDRYRMVVLWLGTVCAPWLSSGAWAAGPPACDASCLRQMADQYLSGMLKHSSSDVPLAASVATTLNASPVGFSNAGPWLTTTGLGSYREYIVDPVGQQVAVVTSTMEGARPAVLTMRLRVQDGTISEAELLIARNRADTGAHFGPDTLSAAEPELSAVVAQSERSSRAELLRIAKTTWTDAAAAPWQAGCRHYEEGEWAKDPRACPLGADSPTDPSVQIPVIDVEHGLVVSYSVVYGYVVGPGFYIPESMLHGENKAMMALKAGAVRPLRASAYVMQVLKVVNGQIRTSQAFMNVLAPGTTSPWVSH